MTEPAGTSRGGASPTHQQWAAEALWEALEPVLPGLSIEVVERIDSTNTELLERLRRAARLQQEGRGGRTSDDFSPQMLVAIHQTSGRGRLGRRWQATPGASLTFSLALALRREDWSGLSLAVGLAVAEALDPQARHIGLKWPNDLMLLPQTDAALPAGGTTGPATRKLGGILIESVATGTRRLAVIGIGLNVDTQRMATTDVVAGSLAEFMPDASPPAVLARLGPGLARALVDFDRQGFAPLAAAYARRDVLRGQVVRTTDAAAPEGVAEGVSETGALRVALEGRIQDIVSGEVSVRPQAA